MVLHWSLICIVIIYSGSIYEFFAKFTLWVCQCDATKWHLSIFKLESFPVGIRKNCFFAPFFFSQWFSAARHFGFCSAEGWEFIQTHGSRSAEGQTTDTHPMADPADNIYENLLEQHEALRSFVTQEMRLLDGGEAEQAAWLPVVAEAMVCKTMVELNIGNDQRRQLQMKTPWWVRKYCDLYLPVLCFGSRIWGHLDFKHNLKKDQLKGPLNQPSDIWALTLNRTYRIHSIDIYASRATFHRCFFFVGFHQKQKQIDTI